MQIKKLFVQGDDAVIVNTEFAGTIISLPSM